MAGGAAGAWEVVRGAVSEGSRLFWSNIRVNS
jgi:hypothetical protein